MTNKTVANDSQDWANSSLEIPSWLYSCIGWSSLFNHLTDGVSFTLRCCWHHFVLSKILLQLPIPDHTEGVVGSKKWCNYDVTVSNGVNLCDLCSEGKADHVTFYAVTLVKCPEIDQWLAVILCSAKWKENSDWSASQVQRIGCRWQALFVLPITALSRSTRGTHFQVMSKGTYYP